MHLLPSSGAQHRQRLFLLLLAALIGLCWLDLALWSLSPYSAYLSHEVLEHMAFGGAYLAYLAVFVFGWLLMTIAMMLPTSLPLVAMFVRMTRNRPDHMKLAWLLVAGYLCVWTLVGGAAHLGDLVVHGAVDRFAWLQAHAWLIGAATLMLAGVYQLTPLKYSCLDRCRSPLSFLSEHWRGSREGLQSFALGVRHGLFCVGCCWHLMLLMFAFAHGNLAWMLALGAVMAAEKNMPWGGRLRVPLALALLVWGCGTVWMGMSGGLGA